MARRKFLLHGRGGIGKTQICLKFIEDTFDRFSHVFWIDASSACTISQSLKGICNLRKAKLAGVDGSLESALLWIGSLKEDYLIVFDNADTLAPEKLESFFPSGTGGNILITSRNPEVQRLTLLGNFLKVTEMDEENSISLLLKAACLDFSDKDLRERARDIVKELWYLPLAVDQAGAFIGRGTNNINDYLRQYNQHRKRLLSNSAFTGASKYNKTVYGTWELSYHQIKAQAGSGDINSETAKNAILLLGIFAFCHHDGIMNDMFRFAAEEETRRNVANEMSLGLPLAITLLDHSLLPLDNLGKWDDLLLKEAVNLLLSFSLIKIDSQMSSFFMHPLVHAWCRDRLTAQETQTYFLMAHAYLACSLSNDFRSQPYPFCRALVAHIRSNLGYIKLIKVEIIHFDDSFDIFGKILNEQGYSSEAVELQLQVLDARRRLLGQEHLHTIAAIWRLARTYSCLGKFIEAEKLFLQVFNTRGWILGQEHPDTLTAGGRLAQVYSYLGKYSQAENLHLQILSERIKILGKEHPETITAYGRLSQTYHKLGKYLEAEELQLQVLDAAKRTLGEEHPDTITATGRLSITYSKLGKYREAEKLQLQVLVARRRVLGEEHPDTLIASGRLAMTFSNLGKYSEAEQLQLQVLDMMEKVIGQKHPDSIYTRGNLAKIYQLLGKYHEAKNLQLCVLEMRNRIFGKEHPDTITAAGDLAYTYKLLGKYTAAEKLQLQVLNDKKRIIGEEHPHTISAAAQLALTYSSLAKDIEAENLQLQVLDARRKGFGPDHPDTITASGDLADTFLGLGRYTEAEKLHNTVLEMRGRILGQDHPEAITSRGQLALTYSALKKYTKAEELQTQVLDARTSFFGEDHPETIRAGRDLGITLSNLEKYAQAEKLQVKVLDASRRVLGKEHPDTITDMIHIAFTLKAISCHSEANTLLNEAVQLQTKILGSNHPKTIKHQAILLSWITEKLISSHTFETGHSKQSEPRSSSIKSKIPRWVGKGKW